MNREEIKKDISARLNTSLDDLAQEHGTTKEELQKMTAEYLSQNPKKRP